MLFEQLIELLRAEGFPVGVDQCIRLERLLRRIDATTDPEKLKSLLCPLFATSAKQQQRFGEIFDQVAHTSAAIPPEMSEATNQLPKRGNWIVWLSLAVLAIAIAAGISLWKSSTRGAVEQETAPAAAVVEYVPITSQVLTVQRVLRTSEPKLQPRRPFGFWWGMALPFVGWAAYEWYRHRRRGVFLGVRRGDEPPYRWELGDPNAQAQVYDTQDFRELARRMSERYAGDVFLFNSERSIFQTARNGTPLLVFTPDRRLPEYVLLIDRRSLRDHQWRLYDEFGHALNDRKLSVTVYTFDEDPRICQDENEHWTSISEIQSRHSKSRLVVAGPAKVLLDPFDGRAAGWTRILTGFEARWLLATGPVDPRSFEGLVDAVPGTVEGLKELLDDDIPGSFLSRILGHQDTGLDKLQDHLGDSLFRWLCACSVYPELCWGLTLAIAALPEVNWGEALLTEGSLLKMARLPWFRDGKFPEELRLRLHDKLTSHTDRAVRRAVEQLIVQCPAPPGSRAQARQDMEVWFSKRWLLRHERPLRQELAAGLRDNSEWIVAQEYIPLMRRDSLKRWRLPEWLCRKLFEQGVPAFGPNRVVRFGLAAALAAAIMLLQPFLIGQKVVPTKGDKQILWQERYVRIPAGSFSMGCSSQDNQCYGNEFVPHPVRITKDFWIGETEVTVDSYRKFARLTGRQMPLPPPFNRDWNQGDRPIVYVNWFDAKDYCEWATNGRGGLPTEAQWEYAARGNAPANRYGPLDKIAWYGANAKGAPHNVKLQLPNLYGARDLLGNVWEWVADWYSVKYSGDAVVDQTGPKQGQYRVVRGGGWASGPRDLRSSVRNKEEPQNGLDTIGMRCVAVP